jgi:LacI family transcriptional regulator
MKARMEDVAKKAGVSTATVSHVINETRFVAEDTKNK